MRTTLFFHDRISRILLDSLDNANTCRDAVSVVKQVSTFAVSNHKRHSVRLANQQGSSRKGSAFCQVSQANPSKCDITWTEASLEYGDVLFESDVHMISPALKRRKAMSLCCLILIAAFKTELLNSNMTYTVLVYPSMKVMWILYICHWCWSSTFVTSITFTEQSSL